MQSPHSKPAVTVLMACYNAEQWLDDSITSVLRQTYVDYEFIIVDDGSTDDTLTRLRQYAAMDKRISILAKSNTGPGDSRNVGIDLARGKWIAIIDADDIYEDTRLEMQIKLASSSDSIVYVGAGLKIIDDAGNILQTVTYPTSHDKLVAHLRSGRKFPPHSSALYLADKVKELGGFRLRIHRAEDWDLWLRLSEIGEMTSLSKPLVRIRKHPAQISHSEGGLRQIIDARIANISYWLRKMNMPDPVNEDQLTYERFYQWVKFCLQESGLFDLNLFKITVKTALNGIFRNRGGLILFFRAILFSPRLTVLLIRNRLFGDDDLTFRLARKWIEQDLEKNK